MIIRNKSEITQAVQDEIARAPDPRFREIVSAAVRHLHAFGPRDEVDGGRVPAGMQLIARLGQLTNASHNEVVLVAGSLGVSSLVSLQNNAGRAGAETTANLLGPFWRMDSPRTESGGSNRALAEHRVSRSSCVSP